MSFPANIDRLFDSYGVPSDTKQAVYDLYVAMGEEVLQSFSDIAERVDSPALLRPEHTVAIREEVARRYLERNHPRWLDAEPTASFWRPREMEGRAAGIAIPIGVLDELIDPREVVGDDQPVPDDAIVVQGRNAHFGGRPDTMSFDLIPRDLDDAVALAVALGQQHTIPGSAGETSGTLDPDRSIALIWEIQPNVYKPAGERNRAIAKIFRRHRNWHLLTLAVALHWLRERNVRTYVLRGSALAPTHEVNRAKPVSQTIVDLHDRTVSRVVDALGLQLVDLTTDDETLLLGSRLMNVGLTAHVENAGIAPAMWRVVT